MKNPFQNVRLHQFLLMMVILIGILWLGESKLEDNSIYLLSHEWCRKCDKVISILKKLQINLNNNSITQNKLNFNFLHNYDDFLNDQVNFQEQNVSHKQKIHFQKQQTNQFIQNKLATIYEQIDKKYGFKRNEIPYPTIWIECKNFKGIYQNQITYLQIHYWINIYCFSQLPKCKQNNQNNINNKGLMKQDYQFQISSQDYKNQQQKIINYQLNHSFIKFCLIKQTSSNNNQITNKVKSFNQIQNELSSGPLFLSHFDHNVRNYLYGQFSQPINQQKLVILILFNQASHSKVRQFVDIYKFISDLVHQDNQTHISQGKVSSIFQHKQQSHRQQLRSQYHRSSIKDYDLRSKLNIYKNLLFIGGCYNENKRDCIMKYEYSVDQRRRQQKDDPHQKVIKTKYEIPFSFTGSKQQNLKRLLQFAHVKNEFEISQYQQSMQNNRKPNKMKSESQTIQIIGFNFDKQSHMIEGYQFSDISVKLGNEFLFWIQNIYLHVQNKRNNNKNDNKQNKQKSHNHYSRQCLSSQLIHIISFRNLSVIENNIKMNRFIDRINNEYNSRIKYRTIVLQQQPQKINHILSGIQQISRWRSEYIKFCIKDEQVKYLTYEQTIKQLTKRYIMQQTNNNNNDKQKVQQQL